MTIKKNFYNSEKETIHRNSEEEDDKQNINNKNEQGNDSLRISTEAFNEAEAK